MRILTARGKGGRRGRREGNTLESPSSVEAMNLCCLGREGPERHRSQRIELETPTPLCMRTRRTWAGLGTGSKREGTRVLG